MTKIEKLILANQITLMLAIRDWLYPSSYNNPDFKRVIITLDEAARIARDAIENVAPPHGRFWSPWF